MDPENKMTKQNDEISLKDVILKSQDWLQYFWKRKFILILAGILGGGIGFLLASLQKPNYPAELTFVLEDTKGSTLSSYAGLASQFGIDLGSNSSSGVFSGDNILRFLQSRLMVEKTLLSSININGKTVTLADYYIEFNELRDGWQGKPALKDLHFIPGVPRSKFSLQQDSILQILYNSISKAHLEVSKPDKKLSFISVKCTTKDELFSKTFTERLVKEATNFYIETKTQKSKSIVDNLQMKADSLLTLLNKKTFSVATAQDMNMNPARSITNVSTEMYARDKLVLQTMYAEVVKNLELSKMSMAQERPIMQIVDSPILPLKKEKFGRLKGIIAGGFIAGLLMLAWIIIRRLYREIMG
ncbi:lipopolysaccharide biosynthesis protein [Chitinophaga deserti]|uniref:lipopolysaccharide biosynthesis protein n=1 Tax=Chitinophaga deserti TaxID=2164099 RepID=UPI000D6C03E6|nr:lipopolysaccharide biosynthesis protein [Chitinophaga deserti]